LPEIVLNAEVNQRLDAFSLERVVVDDTPVNYELTGRRLTVELPEALEPGCSLTLELSFRINVPSIVAGSISSYQGFLGYTPRQLNMGHWLPTVAVYSSGEWITREPAFVGE